MECTECTSEREFHSDECLSGEVESALINTDWSDVLGGNQLICDQPLSMLTQQNQSKTIIQLNTGLKHVVQ